MDLILATSVLMDFSQIQKSQHTVVIVDFGSQIQEIIFAQKYHHLPKVGKSHTIYYSIF